MGEIGPKQVWGRAVARATRKSSHPPQKNPPSLEGGLFHFMPGSTVPAAVMAAASAMSMVWQDNAARSAGNGNGGKSGHGEFGQLFEHGCLLVSGVMRPF